MISQSVVVVVLDVKLTCGKLEQGADTLFTTICKSI